MEYSSKVFCTFTLYAWHAFSTWKMKDNCKQTAVEKGQWKLKTTKYNCFYKCMFYTILHYYAGHTCARMGVDACLCCTVWFCKLKKKGNKVSIDCKWVTWVNVLSYIHPHVGHKYKRAVWNKFFKQPVRLGPKMISNTEILASQFIK